MFGIMVTLAWSSDVLVNRLVIGCGYKRSTYDSVGHHILASSNFVYVIVSILMVVLWSAYLCFDGRREPKKRDTLVIHKLAERTLIRAIP
ncbi:hypothetical protein NECAME_03416 [Necator americanus]|uniref:Uncharacterized protein n=1 Tax=Necator americanus TaxID=51031 RepID=W2T399_NECAM|nr:hypothetical protein NECAME_03416 [Necator americanus]ETN76485.1 hypothetical protein NECAME_03416 [Necator americanus]